jgi:hypothetical protein
MVRAELAAGNIDQAQDLVKRMGSRYVLNPFNDTRWANMIQPRLYPDLVVQRVRDIINPPAFTSPFPPVNRDIDLSTPTPTSSSS